MSSKNVKFKVENSKHGKYKYWIISLLINKSQQPERVNNTYFQKNIPFLTIKNDKHLGERFNCCQFDYSYNTGHWRNGVVQVS